MNETLNQLLKDRRLLQEELRAVEAAIAAYERALQLSLFPQDSNRSNRRRETTIKQDALNVLQKFPSGRSAREILVELNRTVRPELERETLSPQLSRLRRDGKLSYDNGIWSISNGGANENTE